MVLIASVPGLAYFLPSFESKKDSSTKSKAKFETLRREIKPDIRKQHDLFVNDLVGDVKANPRDFYRYINGRKKDAFEKEKRE